MSQAARGLTASTTRRLTWLAGILACAGYLAPSVLMPPNHSDGGLLLDYVRMMAEGQRPFWDFIDAYGPLNWVLPVLAYELAGNEMWATGVYVLGVKLLSVVLAFVLTWRLAGPLWAWLSALWMTALLGAPWQLLQTPYAMHPSLTVTLAVWILLLAPPARGNGIAVPSPLRLLVAGALTGLVVWIKINSGAFLLAGGLFYCFYWLPRDPAVPPDPAPAPPWLRAAWPIGLVAYLAAFLGFIREGLWSLFLVYLVLPLLLGVGLTALELWRSPPDRTWALARLRGWGLFLGAALAVALGYWLVYFGVRGGIRYFEELFAILARLQYESPFPPLGEPGVYVGFNELYWPQLPWVAALLLAGLLGLRVWTGSADGEREGPLPRSAAVGAFLLLTFQTFVIYSRADEAHLVQGVWPAVPVVLVLAGAVWRALGRRRWAAVAVASAAVALAAPLAVPPTFGPTRIGPGEWHSPLLRHLGLHPESSPYIREFLPNLTNHAWDRAANDAADHIDRVTADGTVILVTLRNELIYLNSATRPVGGRHRFLFYLLNQGLISAETFEALIPQQILRDLAERIPPVVVNAYGDVPQLFRLLPDLRQRFEREYEVTGAYAHIIVYERRDRATARLSTDVAP